MKGDNLPNYFEKENHSYLVTTINKSITELRFSLYVTILRDLYSLNTFGSGVGIEMKGGCKKICK